MFDHVGLRVSDFEASVRFYDTLFAPLGIERESSEGWIVEWGDFAISPAEPGKPVTTGLHAGFVAPSREHVDAAWRAGVDAGFADDGEPGLRAIYGPDYYGGFLLDPDGNSAEAVHHRNLRGDGAVARLWIRVADLSAARDFYALIAPFAGYEIASEETDRVRFAGRSGSFSVVVDERPRTEHLHIAFPGDEESVRRFHA